MSDQYKTTYLDDDTHVPTVQRNWLERFPILVEYEEERPFRRHVITSSVTVIGRQEEDVDLWLDERSVSRQHCRLECTGTDVYLTDLGSSNRTYLNGKRVDETQRVFHGDKIRIGKVKLRYYAPGSTDHALFEAAYSMAVQDGLLRIFRKEYLLEKMAEEFALARKSDRPLSLLFLDLDKFKRINDTYGHDAGDRVLQEVCKVLQAGIRQRDILGRFGGEEFCILCPSTVIEDAAQLGERLRVSVDRAVIEYSGTRIPVTVSVGIAALREEMGSELDLVKLADEMVYRSKAAGRNCVSVVGPD